MAIPFYWAGLPVAISFLEAPLKVQVPGITIQLGVGGSQLKFTALNWIEWLLAMGVIGTFLTGSHSTGSSKQLFRYGLLVSLLFWQTVGLLPILNHRIDRYQQHIHSTPELSFAHSYYVMAEVIKLMVPLWLGFGVVSKLVRSAQPDSKYQLIKA